MICVLVMSKATAPATAIVTDHVHEKCSSSRDIALATAGWKACEGMS